MAVPDKIIRRTRAGYVEFCGRCKTDHSKPNSGPQCRSHAQLPRSDRGKRIPFDIPFVLYNRDRQTLSESFESRLVRVCGAYEETLSALRDRNPNWRIAFDRCVRDEQRPAKVADDLTRERGQLVSARAVQKWKERATEFVKEAMAPYDNVDADPLGGMVMASTAPATDQGWRDLLREILQANSPRPWEAHPTYALELFAKYQSGF